MHAPTHPPISPSAAGGIDAYYYAPNGKRYKSMVKVAEVLGLGAVPSPALAGKPCHLAAAAGGAVPMAADGGEAGVARQAISPSARAMGPLAVSAKGAAAAELLPGGAARSAWGPI